MLGLHISRCYPCVANCSEYPELERTHKDHQAQLFVRWLIISRWKDISKVSATNVTFTFIHVQRPSHRKPSLSSSIVKTVWKLLENLTVSVMTQDILQFSFAIKENIKQKNLQFKTKDLFLPL